ncbi:MAG: site-specific DNA-methyltransferase [Gammaproteobacteria bacterium]|nr:MAG: site-specific DNA-methyltransferase [Gammaproteobacteria bacterium]
MITTHKIIFQDSSNMRVLSDESIDLVVTSPPYPMIEMWDQIFAGQNEEIGRALKNNDGPTAFELMHQELDKVWDELYRVLKVGGIACINIGDATRTINSRFALYTNHSRIHTYMQNIGFSALPAILWRKQTNAPNKFMGSGMMPPGAYVTLEHEYILILRKGNKKEFKTIDEKKQRRESSFFWEERNVWFSDLWMDLKGTSQNLFDTKTRGRSAAYPFELPYRLIAMFSIKGDTILDPFFGIGTTMYAAMATARNSIGYEIDPNLREQIISKSSGIVDFSNKRIEERLKKHLAFADDRFKKKGKFKHANVHYLFPVMTRQETDLIINELLDVNQMDSDSFKVSYSDNPQEKYVGSRDEYVLSDAEKKDMKKRRTPKKQKKNHAQLQLF